MGPLCLVVCAFQCLSHKTKFQSQTFKILVSFSAYYQASQELVDECRVFFKKLSSSGSSPRNFSLPFR